MVDRANVSRVAYLSARLDDVDRALAYLAEGGGVTQLAIRNPASETDDVHVMIETPIAVPGLEDALAQLQAQLTAELAALGVA